MKGSYVWGIGCVMTILGVIFVSVWWSDAATALAENEPLNRNCCIIIDPGHGGEDGGATSCTGKLESSYNLEIALRLNDLLHFLGYETYMIRTTDTSIYTQGQTIAQKKISDLKERVRIVNETEHALLLSIHQNHFSDSRYSGAQVFHAGTDGSVDLAKLLQAALVETLNPESRRQCKISEGVYLMEQIDCPGVLIECGFLSNPEEDARLRSPEYQKQLCCVIATVTAAYLAQEYPNT